MNLPLLFARRYLLASRSTAGRSTNAINVITLISIVVIAVVSAAMVVVLSAVNGISELVDTIYSPFDQDITITPAAGKTLQRDSLDVQELLAVSGAALSSWTIEENVLLMHDGQQAVATLKGVEEPYLRSWRAPQARQRCWALVCAAIWAYPWTMASSVRSPSAHRSAVAN
jgi:lipoprotein-releasing system permease protein